MHDPKSYNITLRFGDFAGQTCYQACVKELPDLREYAESADEAYQLALDAIETTAAVMAEQGEPMPQPFLQEEDFSGRVTLRVPRSLHKSLSAKAESEGVSLNQLMVSALSMFNGFDDKPPLIVGAGRARDSLAVARSK